MLWGLFFSFLETRSCYVAQADFKLTVILLPSLPSAGITRPQPPHLAFDNTVLQLTCLSSEKRSEKEVKEPPWTAEPAQLRLDGSRVLAGNAPSRTSLPGALASHTFSDPLSLLSATPAKRNLAGEGAAF